MTPAARIFIVEDQRIISADLESILQRLGYTIAGSAPTGEEAVELVQQVRPDLLLMDIRLGGKMDGIEAAAAVRQLMDLPVVYVTAYADEETISRARATGPFGYIVKPFNDRDLRAAIEIALYKHTTDRALAEEIARREAAEEFRLIVDSIEDYAIFKLEPDGRVATWNAGAERISGYRAEEILGQPVSIFYPPGAVLAREPSQCLGQAGARGRSADEGWRLRKDGSRFWATSIITALRETDGLLHGYAVVMRDLSERKWREDMQRFLDKATVVLASSLDVAATLGSMARLVVPELADWCLIDLADEQGRLEHVAAAHSDPEREGLAQQLARDAARESDLQRGALHVFRTGKPDLHPDLTDVAWAAELLGSDHPELLRRLGVVSYLVVPIQFSGRILGVVNLLRASPPRRYAERDVAVAMELGMRAGIAIENARLYRAAREAIRARDEFLQVASHELRTPLAPLQIQLDMLSRSIARSGAGTERLAARLEAATRQTLRLTRLIDNLLDVARIKGGRLELDLERFDFVELVREVIERFEDQAHSARCHLTVEARGPLLGVWDRERAAQLLENLLSNALKYGAGHPIEVSVSKSDDGVALTVTDHGIGMNAEAIARIFERFERAASSRNYGGLGLGLFIVRQIVEAHGGQISVQSLPGTGSTFTARLPSARDAGPSPRVQGARGMDAS